MSKVPKNVLDGTLHNNQNLRPVLQRTRVEIGQNTVSIGFLTVVIIVMEVKTDTYVQPVQELRSLRHL